MEENIKLDRLRSIAEEIAETTAVVNGFKEDLESMKNSYMKLAKEMDKSEIASTLEDGTCVNVVYPQKIAFKGEAVGRLKQLGFGSCVKITTAEKVDEDAVEQLIMEGKLSIEDLKGCYGVKNPYVTVAQPKEAE